MQEKKIQEGKMEETRIEIENFFNGLTFEELSHRYYLGTRPLYTSVSGMVKEFANPFDVYTKSLKKALEEGVCQKEILDRWEEKKIKASKLGTETHSFGEKYVFDRDLIPSNGYEKAVVNFWKIIPEHIVPVVTELRMYHKRYLFAGTCDILLFNKNTGEYILCDYKTNERLFKNYAGERLLKCFSDLLKHDFNLYQIQLSLYQLLFEQTGHKIGKRKIIHLKNDGRFQIYDTINFIDRLQGYLEDCHNDKTIQYE